MWCKHELGHWETNVYKTNVYVNGLHQHCDSDWAVGNVLILSADSQWV